MLPLDASLLRERGVPPCGRLYNSQRDAFRFRLAVCDSLQFGNSINDGDLDRLAIDIGEHICLGIHHSAADSEHRGIIIHIAINHSISKSGTGKEGVTCRVCARAISFPFF